jgi:hypothetical protein
MAEAGVRGREWNTGRLEYHRHSYRRPVSNHGASASDSTSAHVEPHVEDAGVGELPAGRPNHRRDSGARGISSTKRTGHRQCAVAEELVDVFPGIDDGGHDDLEQGVEAGDRVLGGDSTPR